MKEPAYVRIASEYARRIRSGALAPRAQLPTHAEIGYQYEVSDVVVRKAVELLQRQGLVRSVRRRGIFVADRPNLVRAAPERQLEDPEDTFADESTLPIRVERQTSRIPVPDDHADTFGLSSGDEITLVVTRVSEDGRPVSISDTYQPVEVADISDAIILEETLADQLPTPAHAEWLRIGPGELVKTVYQRFLADSDRVVMVSTISYPPDRYDAFVFRMALTLDS